MRQQALIHASVPCAPLDNLYMEDSYIVEKTGAMVNLSSSVSLLNFYCSRLPSDRCVSRHRLLFFSWHGYDDDNIRHCCYRFFKPTPRFLIDKDSCVCTLLLPRGCPIQTVVVQGHPKQLRQLVCLEACKKLHEVGALTDHLVPDIVWQEKDAQQITSAGNSSPFFYLQAIFKFLCN